MINSIVDDSQSYVTSKSSMPILHKYIEKRKPAYLRLLLNPQFDCNLDTTDPIFGFTPLQYAVYIGYFEGVHLLLEAGANTATSCTLSESQLSLLDLLQCDKKSARSKEEVLKIEKLLIERGVTYHYLSWSRYASAHSFCSPVESKPLLFSNKLNDTIQTSTSLPWQKAYPPQERSSERLYLRGSTNI